MNPQTTQPPSPLLTRLAQVAAGGLIFLLAAVQPAPASEGDVEDLPQVVIDALEEVVPGLQFTEINIEVEDEGTEYEIHGVWQSREVEAKLNELGEFIDLQIGGHDDGGGGGDLPELLRGILNMRFHEPAIVSVAEAASGGLEHYEVAITSLGRDQVVRITPTGTLLSVSTAGIDIASLGTVPTDRSSLPDPVTLAAGELEVERAWQVSHPQVAYLLGGMQGKALVTMLVAASGELLGYEFDRDADGVADLAESAGATHYDQWDSDGDHYPDGFELSEGTDPLDASLFPQVLSIQVEPGEAVLSINIRTFRGADFLLEQCGDTAGDWQAVGACTAGDGGLIEFVLPLIEEIKRCFFRVRVIPGPLAAAPHGDTTGSVSGNGCHLPESLVGGEISISDGEGESRLLSFRTATRGEIVEHEGGEVELTPFAYTFEEVGECELRVTLVFSTSDGFETEVFTLTFTSELVGAYVSQDYEGGEPEDPEEGDFTLTMN